jgi:glutaminase
MGATLASGGVDPLTGERVIKARNVAGILAEMATEQLYERFGDWAFGVGLPGNSGVGLDILAVASVAPGRAAIAGFPPPLDPADDSVKGQRGWRRSPRCCA